MHHLLALLLTGSAVAIIATGGFGTLAEEGESNAGGAVQLVAQIKPENWSTGDCLSEADLREAVAEKRVIAPFAAIRAAREVIPRAEIQRASLCRHDDKLVYRLTALRRDGQFVQVTVDAQSGQIAGR